MSMNRDGREHEAGGKFTEMKGAIKEGAGKLVGNERMEAEGNLQKNAGKVRSRCACGAHNCFLVVLSWGIGAD